MITVISSTNRVGSYSALVAREINRMLQEEFNRRDAHLLDLATLDWEEIIKCDYRRTAGVMKSLTENCLVPTKHFVFVVPEYNGSFPGALKLLIDFASIIDYKGLFVDCSIHLIGVSEGRAGNLRGLDQLSCILRHMGAQVIHKPQPISSIKSEVKDGELSSELKKALRIYLTDLRI